MPLLNICHIEMMDQISTRILWVFYVSADYAMSVHTFYPVCVMQCDVSGPFAAVVKVVMCSRGGSASEA